MALDDRDRTFEKALARHLRSSFPGADGALPAQSSQSACPDAETLAAYHDGTLSAEERNLWKEHVLACDDCQLVLSHLVEPLDVSLARESGEPVAATPALTTASLQLQQAASSAPATAPAPVVILRPRRTYFRWLAPAGAVAAGLLAFVVFRESRPARTLPTDRIELADNNQPVPVPPPAPAHSSVPTEAKQAIEREEPTEAAPKKEKDLALVSPTGAPASAPSSRSDAGALRKEQRNQNQAQLTQQAQGQYAANTAHGPSVNQQQQQRPRALRVLPGPTMDAKKAQDKADAELAQGGRDLAAKVAPPPPVPAAPLPSDQSSFIADNSVSAPSAKRVPAATAPSASGNARAGVAGASAEALPQTVTVESSDSSALMLQAGLSQGPSTFRSPAGDVLWRVGLGGSLERSSDSGTTWIPQASGVTNDLTTGFALSGRVCWVVGTAGTILRTIDGGAHWIKIGSPADAPIIAIRATDAFHATVLVVDDAKTGATKAFKTADGGINWSPVPKS